jgi:hypothetical protein
MSGLVRPRMGKRTRVLCLAATCSSLLSTCSSPSSPSEPNVQGFYHGGWMASSCSATGHATCPGPGQLPVFGGFNLRVYQSGQSLRAFIFICEGEINEATGSLGTDGTITLSGQDAVSTWAPITLSAFRASVSGGSLNGTFACTTYNGTFSSADTMSWTGTLSNVVLVSPDPNVPY